MIKTNWIKMRSSLLTHPKVISMVNYLSTDDAFLHFVCDEVAISACTESISVRNVFVTDIVTRSALRYVTVSGLLALWSAARMFSNGGTLDGISIHDLDEMAGVPGIGKALEHAGWARYDAECKCVVLKDFGEWNDQEFKEVAKSNAERQREWRLRKKSGVTKSNESNGREEKSREEKKKDVTPPSSPQEPAEADGGDQGKKDNFIAPASRDPFASLYPPPLVSEKLPNYTGSVVAWAWEVGSLFARANPERRNHETAAKIVKRFADTLSRTGQAGFEKLKRYYSLNDPTKWQDEVNSGVRLPIGSSPLDVCELLFPKSQHQQNPPSPRLPTGEELKRREAETLARLGGAMTDEQREAIKAKRRALA